MASVGPEFSFALSSGQQLQTPAGSREGTPGPEEKPNTVLNVQKPPPVTKEKLQSTMERIQRKREEAIAAAIAAATAEMDEQEAAAAAAAEQPPAEQPPAEQPPAEQPPAEQPPAEQPPAEQPAGKPGATGAESTPLHKYENAFLETMSETLPDLNKMCTDSPTLCTYILEGCRQFKRQHADKDVVDFLVYMEYQADKTETDEQMNEQIVKYLGEPTSLDPTMEDKHTKATEKMHKLKVLEASRFYTDAEQGFLNKHAAKYLSKIGSSIAQIADFTLKFGPKFKERHPKDDIFELLCYGELTHEFYPKDADARIQEFIEAKELPRIENMEFGNDTDLAQQRRQQALNVLEGFRKPQPDPTQPGPTTQPKPNVDPAAFYNAAERRNFRKQFIATAEDPAADLCVIEDPETKKPVEATIIARHPHRRKWLICAIPTNNPEYPMLERFPTIDGDQHRDILENYSLQGSDRTIPVGSIIDLRGISMEEFELNGVILLPWGKEIRISGLGLSNSRNREFKMFSKTVLCQKWGRAGLAMLHAHLQKCGSRIPAGKNMNELELQPQSWYGP